jgi:hypothetical protein
VVLLVDKSNIQPHLFHATAGPFAVVSIEYLE